MSESPKQWVGQIADAKFPLQQFLGGTNHSAVFLTQLPGTHARAALKLIQVNSASTNLQLSRWSAASQLSHPNLLRILAQGTCGIAGMNFLYVVTEHAPEDLSQVLPERSLTAEETREMLQPVLGALAYLHEKKLVHGHLIPSNILAIDDKVKLSSDSIFPAGESRINSRDLDVSDAPEFSTHSVSMPADVWSLATTIVEVLTQKLPVRQDTLQIDPTFSQDLPEPFLEIARRSLRLDPIGRWTVAGIAAHLNPKPALAAAAGASPTPNASASSLAPAAASSAPLSPLAVPLSNVAPLPVAKLPDSRPYSTPKETRRAPVASRPRPRFALVAIAAILLFGMLFLIPKLLNHRVDTSASLAPTPPARTEAPSAPAKSDSTLAKPKSTVAPIQQASSPAPAVAQPPVQPASAKQHLDRNASAAAPAPALALAKTPDAAPISKPTATSSARGEVLDQILPPVSDKARATIHGKVRVTVRVHVDPSGNVSQAELDNAGPSQFFADLALQAARRWEFTSPEVDGHSFPSVWLIRFEFTPSDTKAFPTQTEPKDKVQ